MDHVQLVVEYPALECAESPKASVEKALRLWCRKLPCFRPVDHRYHRESLYGVQGRDVTFFDLDYIISYPIEGIDHLNCFLFPTIFISG